MFNYYKLEEEIAIKLGVGCTIHNSQGWLSWYLQFKNVLAYLMTKVLLDLGRKLF